LSAQPPELTGEATIRVPFHDADPAGVLWHGRYFEYFDAARCDLLDRIDYGYRAMAESGWLWPVVDARVRYVRPIRYEDEVTVTARLLEWEYRLRIAYEIRGADGGKRTSGWTVQVAVSQASGELSFGVPAFLQDRIARFLGA
jgi:acyl-CoA thioester hydrolase